MNMKKGYKGMKDKGMKGMSTDNDGMPYDAGGGMKKGRKMKGMKGGKRRR